MGPHVPRMLWHILTVYFCIHRFVKALEVEDAPYAMTFQQLLQSGELDLHSDNDQYSLSNPLLPSLDRSSNDNGFRTTRFLPWSYERICTQHLPRLSDRLCVYTNTSFSNGRAISIFTTPPVASSLAGSLSSSQHATSHAGDRKSSGINPYSGNWYTAPVLDKGIGMLATHDLNRGDVITAYTPVLLAFKESFLPKTERERLLQVATSQLPAASREAFLNLTTLNGDSATLVQSIASANAFEIVLDGKPHLAIMPEPSRINHDCAPNAIFHVNSSSLTHVVRATRPINKNEEIAIAYTNPLEPSKERQKYLQASFGFTCTCHRCLRGSTSDAALSELASLQESLSHWSDPTSTASTKQAVRLIQLYHAEGLEGYIDPAYCLAALVYSSVGSERGAERYLSLCIEAVEVRLGEGAKEVDAWKDMEREGVRTHWSWMRRKRV